MNNIQLLQNTSLYTVQYSSQFDLDHAQSSSRITYATCVHPSDVLHISTSKDIFIPVQVLRNNSSLEAIVCYLKDILDMTYVDIARFMNRDQRTIWVTYHKAKRKNLSVGGLSVGRISGKEFDKEIFDCQKQSVTDTIEYIDDIYLPINLFASRIFSILETVVFYLKNDQGLSFNQISNMLGKNYRTVWTVYRRAIKKLSEKNLGVESEQ